MGYEARQIWVAEHLIAGEWAAFAVDDGHGRQWLEDFFREGLDSEGYPVRIVRYTPDSGGTSQ